METEIGRKRFYFTGRVQGVGFRFKAMMHAESLELTGFVQNLSDGRVLMEAQGIEASIDRLIFNLQNETRIQITDMKVEDIPIVWEEKTFRYEYM